MLVRVLPKPRFRGLESSLRMEARFGAIFATGGHAKANDIARGLPVRCTRKEAYWLAHNTRHTHVFVVYR